MIPLHRDRHLTFRFGESRITPRCHLEGVGVRVSAFGFDATTETRPGLLTTATVGAGGWADRPAPLVVRSGEGAPAVPEEVSP